MLDANPSSQPSGPINNNLVPIDPRTAFNFPQQQANQPTHTPSTQPISASASASASPPFTSIEKSDYELALELQRQYDFGERN